MKKKSEILSENFQFSVVKFSIYLNRRVFIMRGLIVFYQIIENNIMYIVFLC